MGCGASIEKKEAPQLDSPTSLPSTQEIQNVAPIHPENFLKLDSPPQEVVKQKRKALTSRESRSSISHTHLKRIASDSEIQRPGTPVSVAMSRITKRLVKGAEGEKLPQISITIVDSDETHKTDSNTAAA